MELTYNELLKREVINIVDGKCLGRITNMKFCFPQGIIKGIEVEGRKMCFLFRAFNKSNIYIPDTNIVKIGGDVILVNLKCGDTCLDSVGIKEGPRPNKKPPCPPGCNPCGPPPINLRNPQEVLSEEKERSGGSDMVGTFNFDEY